MSARLYRRLGLDWRRPEVRRRYKRVWTRRKRGTDGEQQIRLAREKAAVRTCAFCNHNRLRRWVPRRVRLGQREITALVPWCGKW